MRVDALHRRIRRDVTALHEEIGDIFLVQVPEGTFNLKAFVNRLNLVTEKYHILNVVQNDKTQPYGTVAMSGEWLAKSELPELGSYADIRVFWHVNPTRRRVELTKAEWSRRRFYFWAFLTHELIHRYQAEFRGEKKSARHFKSTAENPNDKTEQDYLGDYDEIEAHSYNAAVELVTWWPHLSFRDAKFESLSYTGRVLSPTLNMFIHAFVTTPKHPAIDTFKRKLHAWYNIVQSHPEFYQELELPKLV